MSYADQQWDKALALWDEYFGSCQVEQHGSVSEYLCQYFDIHVRISPLTSELMAELAFPVEL